ncbi:MAG TPA: CdaR family protein [candidate division Zixibacteria bacterium]
MWEKLLDNLWLKLGAILLAFLLWFYASTDKPYEYTFNYNLRLINLSPELILAEPLPDMVKVKIYGKGKELLKLFVLKERSLKIDARKYYSGEFEDQIKTEMVTIPEGLNLSALEIVSPKVLKVNLQKIEEKKVPLISQLSFSVEEGYFQKGEIRFTPEKVWIKGPSENVNKIKYILTQKKEFQDLSESFSGKIDLISPPFFNLKISPPRVDFSVEVQKGEKKRLENLPITLINIPRGRKIHLTPKTINLELLGEKEILEKLTLEKIKVIIDCQGIKRGETKTSPLIQLPEDILLFKTEPDSFNLIVN